MALDIKGCSGRVYVEFRHVWCMCVCPQWCAKENYMEGITSRFKRQIMFCIADQPVASFRGSSRFVSCVGDPCVDIVLHLNSLYIILLCGRIWLSYISGTKMSTQLNTTVLTLNCVLCTQIAIRLIIVCLCRTYIQSEQSPLLQTP